MNDDCISRSEALKHSYIVYDDELVRHNVVSVEDIEELPTIIEADKAERDDKQKQLRKPERKFEAIVVEYPPAELCTYPEYIGKPYFSIKYEENGEHIIRFGTYNPVVLSMYLKEYFIAPTIIEAESEDKGGE